MELGMKRGMKQGLECGIEQGMERGIAQGLEQGIAQGMERGLEIYVTERIEDGYTKDQIIAKLVTKFQLSPDDAERYYGKYSEI